MLIFWNFVAFNKDGFLEDENGKFLPRNSILEAIESAVIFYYIKKDKELEKLIRKYLTQKPKLKEISKEIKKIVFKKYPILNDIEIPEKIYIEDISNELVKVFNLEKKEFIKSFRLDVAKSVIDDIKIKSNNIEKIKNACKAFAKALADYEHKELKNTELEENITEIQNLISNEWEIPLRIGYWTDTPLKGDLLFFWRIKEIRDYLIKELKTDIRPKNILYLPRVNEFLGWSELKEI